MRGIGFAPLCQELSRLQMRLLQRQTSAQVLSAEAVSLLRNNLECIQATTENVPYVPLFLRSCASLLQSAPSELSLETYDAIIATSKLAEQYVGGRHGDVNTSSSVLRSIMALEKCHDDLTKSSSGAGTKLEEQREEPPHLREVNPFSSLTLPAYNSAYSQWREQRIQPTTLAVLSLVQGSSSVYGKAFHFSPASHDMRGLLPCKRRVLMEAKMQRCFGARELVTALRGMEFNRLDAGMCLNTLAETGFYDEEVCNQSCNALFTAHALVTSQQLCEMLYSLGVLQHRHVHVKFLASLIDAKKCDAAGVLKQVVGLAMLQQPPHYDTQLLDGVFLHALRSSNRGGRGKPKHNNHDHRRKTAAKSPHSPSPSSSTPTDMSNAQMYQLPPMWYIDAAHALSCLGIHSLKFKLMLSRQARRSIAWLSTAERCKLLYGLGGVRTEDVPPELLSSWQSKLERTREIVYERLKEISPEDGPQVVSALHYSGVRDHPSIPRMPDLAAAMGENPADVILRTWSRTSKERIMQLTEQIEPHHLQRDEAAKVAQLVSCVADTCGPSLQQETYRFGPLVAAVDASGAGMSIKEVLATVDGLQRMDLVSHYAWSLRNLLEVLWHRREEMSSDDLVQVQRSVSNLHDISVAAQLADYAGDRIG